MRLRALACVLATMVAGCSTVSRDMAFDTAGGAALALVAADGMIANGSQSYSFTFQRMGTGQQAFLPDIFSINFSGLGPIEGNEFKKPEQLHTTLRFGGLAVPPGEYALISRIDSASYGMSNSTVVNCFSEGAAVFRIHKGRVNIIPAGHVKGAGSIDGAIVQPQVATVLAGYPNITAPIAFADIVGSTKFKTGKNILGGELCKGTAVVSFANHSYSMSAATSE
jgi:hypothetical protein